MNNRPLPPVGLIDDPTSRFVPAPDLADWVRQTFILPDASLNNPDHAHLEHAHLGMLWTNVGNSRQGRTIVGQCESGEPKGAMGRWSKARIEQQTVGWFGIVPDFILTFDAHHAAQCSDAEFCALVEHELYHAGQERNEYGAPKFTKDGRPKYGMRGHDIEEFVGVVRRYGADAAHVQALIEAASHRPEVAPIRIAQACGTCQLRAA